MKFLQSLLYSISHLYNHKLPDRLCCILQINQKPSLLSDLTPNLATYPKAEPVLELDIDKNLTSSSKLFT